jgi:hypothetical protein
MASWKSGTKRAEIAKFAARDMSATDTYHAIRPLVHEQIRPWIFSANVAGTRRPKAINQQLIELRHEVNRVFAILGRDGIREDEIAAEEMEIPTEDEEIETAVEAAEEVAKKLPPADKDERRFFLDEIRRIRKWIENRGNIGDIVDEISMRPVVAAKTALAAGIPAKALLHSMTMHWNPETRTAAGIAEFDFEGFSAEVAKKEKLASKLDNGEKLHRMAGLAYRLAQARIPIMAVGPSGTGKSHLAKQTASFFGLTYGECPMTAGATPSWLLGSNTIDGFISRPFLEAYSKGGIFNFEEIDASDPNMLLVANNALASDKLFNPMNGEVYERHADFIPFSTANTFGLGANRQHSARERLDAATIDRWRMGRVFVPIDETLEESILFS